MVIFGAFIAPFIRRKHHHRSTIQDTVLEVGALTLFSFRIFSPSDKRYPHVDLYSPRHFKGFKEYPSHGLPITQSHNSKSEAFSRASSDTTVITQDSSRKTSIGSPYGDSPAC